MTMFPIKWTWSLVLVAAALMALGCSASKGPAEESSSLHEGLTVLNASSNVNVSRLTGNQSEAAIAADPTNPNRLFLASNAARGALFGAFSTDGGQTWNSSQGPSDTSPNDFSIADGNDTLTTACCDPTVSFDSFGNLFLGYLGNANLSVVIAISTDGGATFQALTSLAANTDQPTVVTGPGAAANSGSLWVSYASSSGAQTVQGASVTGLGAANVAAFGAAQTVAAVGSFGDIAVGPSGQVTVAYQNPNSAQGPDTIFAATDADGLGAGGFASPVTVSATNVGGFDLIPPQNSRSVDAEIGLAYDRSPGPNAGRLYVVYTDEVVDESSDTDIFVRTSNDNGATWSAPLRVNDDATTNSQFLPRIALDQTTGFVAVSWHDARNDSGSGSGDTDGVPNTDTQFFASASIDGGATFEPNIRVSAGTSNAPAAGNGIEYGDYTGLTFQSGRFHPAWADNSNSTNDNPDGTLSSFDIYTASVSVNQAPVAVCKNVLVAANATCGATVTANDVNNGSFDPDGPPLPTCTLSPSGAFGLGSTPVTLTCVDAQGASSTCTATVTVVDNTPPSIVCPVSVNVACVNAGGATATFATSAADNCGGVGTPVCTRPSGSNFPLGTTVDTCSVLDASGNAATCSFNVTVALADNPICCPAGTHVIVGTTNNDFINGTAGPDCIIGRGGQDTINGNGGNDIISAGDGDDLVSGGIGDDLIFGGTGQDRLSGDSGNDTMSGGDGDDQCFGADGNDTLLGGAGQDRLFGDNDDDTLVGETGDDRLEGGNGNDSLNGGGPHDVCIGGPGLDTFLTCQSQTQ